MSSPTAGAGRPSLAAPRRREAVAAFLSLIAERGLDSVTLDEVARRSGMQRSVVRHYVGNRDELVQAALDELVDDYRASIVAAVGPEPSINALIDHLFGVAWYRDQSVADRALDVLFHEAARSPEVRARLKRAYETLIDLVTGALDREAPGAGASSTARETAYAVVCLAEHNADLQSLGFDEQLAASTKQAAVRLVQTAIGSDDA